MTKLDRDKQLAVVIFLSVTLGIIGTLIELDSGYVLDAETGTPLSGAWVLSRWQGDLYQIVKSHSHCMKVNATTTDGEGRYTQFSTSFDFNPLVNDVDRTMLFYHPGYEVLQVPAQFTPWRTYLKRDGRVGLERIRHIIGASVVMNCGHDENTSASVDYFRAIQKEVQQLAVKPEDMEGIESALVLVERLRFGAVEARIRQREREKKKLVILDANK
jgi:hypothetical protein